MGLIEDLYERTSQLSGSKRTDQALQRGEDSRPGWGNGELIPVKDRSIEELLADHGQFPDSDVDEDGERLRIGVTEQGVEALAFYKSVRYLNLAPFPGRWGIFYLASGLRLIEREILMHVPGCPKARKHALDFLRAHELFHVQVDTWAMASEGLLRKPLYTPMVNAFAGRSVDAIEEALANARAMKWARNANRGSSRGIAGFAKGFMLSQPGAYARFASPMRELRSELGANLFDTNIALGARRDDQADFAAYGGEDLLKNHCPEWWVLAASVSRWCPPTWAPPKIASVVET